MVDEIKTEDIDSWSLDGNARCGSIVSLPTYSKVHVAIMEIMPIMPRLKRIF